MLENPGLRAGGVRVPQPDAAELVLVSASGLSPQLADAPPGLVPLAFQAGAMTGIDPNVLLAIAKVETDCGRVGQGQP